MSVKYPECVCVSVCILALVIRHAKRIYCHLWLVWLYNIFPRFLVNGTIFEKKKINY